MTDFVKRAPRQAHISGDHPETWDGLKQNAIGDAIEMSSGGDVDVQVTGTFGGAVLIIQGSNTVDVKGEYVALTGPFGGPLEFADGGTIKRAASGARWVRPSVFGGDDTTNLKVAMLVRRKK